MLNFEGKKTKLLILLELEEKNPWLEQRIQMLIIYIFGIKLEMVVDVPCKCVQKVMFPLVTHSSSPIWKINYYVQKMKLNSPMIIMKNRLCRKNIIGFMKCLCLSWAFWNYEYKKIQKMGHYVG